jgi:hypothetical protein
MHLYKQRATNKQNKNEFAFIYKTQDYSKTGFERNFCHFTSLSWWRHIGRTRILAAFSAIQKPKLFHENDLQLVVPGVI